ncbi:hypothetical protein V4S50_09605, partial [Citrobacter freundii]|uniref:hypothetical protein n=1 Tax=Citrobacter freundii TaxID=546 RepID=UPI002F96A818
MRNAHDSATGHVFLAGDALTSMLDEHHAQDSPHAQGIEKLLLLLGLRLASGRSGAAGSAVFQGRQASRGGDSPQGFPLEASEAPRARRHRHRAQQKEWRVGRKGRPPGWLGGEHVAGGPRASLGGESRRG